MNPRPATRHLKADLDREGRQRSCAVPGCTAGTRLLTVHHIVPVRVMRVEDSINLAYLCVCHHALVERYYWWAQAKLDPGICRLIREIARQFRAKAVHPLEIARYKEKSQAYWDHLSSLSEVQNPLWWQATFTKACRWASHQEILRFVHPEHAIVEEPWFRDVRQGAQVQESEAVA